MSMWHNQRSLLTYVYSTLPNTHRVRFYERRDMHRGERPDWIIRRMSQAWACERYDWPANTPFSRMDTLYRFTSEQRLLHVCVPSAQMSAGSVSAPQIVQRRFPSPPFLERRENRAGLVGFIDFFPESVVLGFGTSRRTGYWTIRKYPMCFFGVSAYRALMSKFSYHLSKLDGCHDVHFDLLEKGVGWRRI